jgi:dipeptidyl aminopeptidase/acylaminoacyl peptidase
VIFPILTHWRCLFIVTFVCTTAVGIKAETKRLLTPEACTEIRYIAEGGITDRPRLQLSPDGLQAAYVLQVPDLISNDNKEELYVAAVNPQSSQSPTPVISNQFITAIRWFPDNRHLAVLLRRGQRIVIAQVDSVTKTQEIIWEADNDITDYSIDAAGQTIAIAERTAVDSHFTPENSNDLRKGYRLDLASTAHSQDPKRRVYILRRGDDHHWNISEPLRFISPLSGRSISDITDNHSMHVDISPDGKLLLLDNLETFSDIPKGSAWERSPAVQEMRNRGVVALVVSYLYDISTSHVSMPLDTPYVLEGLWAPDSKSYVKLALAPVGSQWEKSDLEKGTPNIHITHLFSVNVVSGQVSEVLNRAEKEPVGWTRAGEIIVRDPTGVLVTLKKISDQWKPVSTIRILPAGAAPYDPFVSDGDRAIMQYQSAIVAPKIAAFDLKSGSAWTVATLNPEVNGYVLPKTKSISWTTSDGFEAKGLLLLPPNYDPHLRYPLVIETGSILYNGEFACDSAMRHVSSFTRGILADAGVIYLMRDWPGINDWETNYYPKGYPGHIAEAAYKQDLIESAVKALDKRKMIDPAKVGLVGFSRGGWYVDYMLTHSHIPFKVASATDNVLYSMGEYWYWNNEHMARAQEGMYGGPPAGKTLKNWLDYSISFNLDKIHTPLLMEVMGNGKRYDNSDSPPDNIAVHNEIFVGLSQLHKPVEYYYYPNEQHQPDHPIARIASLQRNVDWFLFWLQGYERPYPEDPNQYKRWETLRAQEIPGSDERDTKLVQTHSY